MRQYEFKPPIDVFILETTVVDLTDPKVPAVTFTAVQRTLTSLSDLEALADQLRSQDMARLYPTVGEYTELPGFPVSVQVTKALLARSSDLVQSFVKLLMKNLDDCEEYGAQDVLKDTLEEFEKGIL